MLRAGYMSFYAAHDLFSVVVFWRNSKVCPFISYYVLSSCLYCFCFTQGFVNLYFNLQSYR